MKTEITYFYRQAGHAFSMEEVFATVRAELDVAYAQQAFFCPHRRAAPGVMWANSRQARRAASAINHITGEVHYLALALPQQGLVLTIHDTGDTNAFHGWKQWVFRQLWYVQPVKRAAAVTFISEHAQRSVEALVGFPIPQGRVIPDPVSARFQFAPKAFPSAKPRILCIGTKPNKNLERLAEALRGLDVELRIIGQLRAEQQAALVAHAIDYTSVQGLRAEAIVAEYERADIVSLISTFEGFGLPIVEAQAVGRPVITSNIEPLTETAADGALLVDPFDVAAMRAGFQQLLCNAALRARLIAAGRRNVERFSAKSIARQYEAVYRSVSSNP